MLATDPGELASYESYSGVGFAEITVPGVQVTETLRLPTDLLTAVGTDDLGHPLYLMVTRNRADAQANGRQDPEPAMHREVELPSGRSFTLIGDVRLSPSITDAQLAALVGGTDGAVVSASSALPGALDDRGRAAFDGDPATWWTPRIGDTAGAWVQIDAPTATTPGELTVTFAADGRHSVPSSLSVQADGTTVATVEVPDAPDGAFGTTRSVTIPIPAGTSARSWRLTVDDVHARMTNPWLGGADYALPVAIADVDGLGVAPAALRDTVDTGCRTDLVSRRRPARPRPGSPAPWPTPSPAARSRWSGCDDLALPAGTVTIDTHRRPHHRARRRPGAARQRGRRRRRARRRLGLHGRGRRPPSSPQLPTAQPTVTVTSTRPDEVELEVSDLTDKSWLVLGQSFSEGWTATSPELGDLGAPTLIQGYANGWVLDPATGTVHVTLEWGPQKVVWAGIGVSLIGVPLCLLILLVPWVRRRRRRGGDSTDDDPTATTDAPLADAAVAATPTADDEVISPAIGEPWPAEARAPRTGWGAPLGLGALVLVFAGLNLPTGNVVLTVVLALVLGGGDRRSWCASGGAWPSSASSPRRARASPGPSPSPRSGTGRYRNFEWPQIFDPVPHRRGLRRARPRRRRRDQRLARRAGGPRRRPRTATERARAEGPGSAQSIDRSGPGEPGRTRARFSPAGRCT